MRVTQVGKSYAARAARAGSKREAEALAAEGLERVAAVYTKGAGAVDGLKDMAKQLRRLPVVDLALPTVPAACPPPGQLVPALLRPCCTRCHALLSCGAVLHVSAMCWGHGGSEALFAGRTAWPHLEEMILHSMNLLCQGQWSWLIKLCKANETLVWGCLSRWHWWARPTWARAAWCRHCPRGSRKCATTPSPRAPSRWATSTSTAGATRHASAYSGSAYASLKHCSMHGVLPW